MKRLLLLLSISSCFQSFSQTILFSNGSSWKYNDSGTDLGNTWQSSSFDDATWLSGSAEFGYGDGDEQTVVSFGSNSGNKHITTYFRKTFFVSNPSQFQEILGSIRRDDGAVVYVNGMEVFRTNMPGGTVSFGTVASSAISLGGENTFYSFAFSPAVLVNGNNTVAVEIHQESASSSDISFNMSLSGSTTPQVIQVTREPYLNTGTPNSMIVRWQTSVPCDSKVRYGLSPSNLNLSATVVPYATEHTVTITGLQPETKYYYSTGTSANELNPASSIQYFKTSPLTGTTKPFRFWAIGDAGMSDGNQRAVRDGFLIYNNNEHVDGWIMLGDNAYGNGFNDGNQSCYQTALFDNMYASLISKTVCWPALGNHDYNNHIPFSPSPAYFDIFNLPSNGEAGGLASGTEKYYSYNYGNIHFIVLDSYDEDRSPNAPMATWLISDLQQNTSEWIVAYWHHPPYTKGSHDSDNPNFLDGECVDIRENILPILEQYGVDLVLNGHSHSYERSFLVDSHYGNSGSLTQNMIIDGGTGGNSDDCPYQKETIFNKAHKGTIYAVVGSSGKLSSVSSSWPHPVTSTADHDNMGSMLFTIHANRLDADFVSTTGSVLDHFSIIKNAGKTQTITACQNELITLTPSFPGKVNWSPNNLFADSISVLVNFSTMYLASDTNNCIVDTFFFQLDNSIGCTAGLGSNSEVTQQVWITSWDDDTYLPIRWTGFSGNSISIEVFSLIGEKVISENFQNQKENQVLIPASKLVRGTYIIHLSDGEHSENVKFLH